MSRKYRVISADGHVELPPDPWVKYVPEKHRDRAPRLVRLPDGGGDAWVVEGQPLLHTGQAVTGSGPVKFDRAFYYNDDGSPVEGTGGGVQRLHEQDRDGIDAEVLFPPVFATRFINGVSDHDAYLSMVQAFNTYLGEEYCAVAPDRLIANAFIPVSGIDDAVAELERASRLGLRTVNFHQFPNGGGSPKAEDDRFWEKALELGMALSPHVTFGDRAGPQPPPPSSDQTVTAAMVSHCAGNTPAYSLAHMIVNGVFDRFPELKLYYAETNCALLPGMLAYMDRDYLEYNDWFQLKLDKLPSEYVLEHALFGLVRETVAIKMAQANLMPMDWFMWGSDFPHSIGTYPESEQYRKEAFADLSEDMRHRILLDNPIEFFGLDADADLTETPPLNPTA